MKIPIRLYRREAATRPNKLSDKISANTGNQQYFKGNSAWDAA
jgi:hypothetical protein